MKTLLTMLLACLAIPGCIIGEPCTWQDLEVRLVTEAYSGPAPLEISLQAHGQGFSCGCCDENPTSIVHYQWDVDDDGLVDLEGPDLTSCSVSYPEPGVFTLRVTVTDDAGGTATDTLVLEVLDPAGR